MSAKTKAETRRAIADYLELTEALVGPPVSALSDGALAAWDQHAGPHTKPRCGACGRRIVVLYQTLGPEKRLCTDCADEAEQVLAADRRTGRRWSAGP